MQSRTCSLTVAAALAAAALAPLPVAAVEPPAHCDLLVEGSGRDARVVWRHCARDGSGAALMARADKVEVMTWYENWYYGGATTSVYADARCTDGTSYVIRGISTAWDDRISSFRVRGGCDHTRAYTGPDQTGDQQDYPNQLGVRWVGDAMNDRISSFWIWRGAE